MLSEKPIQSNSSEKEAIEEEIQGGKETKVTIELDDIELQQIQLKVALDGEKVFPMSSIERKLGDAINQELQKQENRVIKAQLSTKQGKLQIVKDGE